MINLKTTETESLIVSHDLPQQMYAPFPYKYAGLAYFLSQGFVAPLQQGSLLESPSVTDMQLFKVKQQ